ARLHPPDELGRDARRESRLAGHEGGPQMRRKRRRFFRDDVLAPWLTLGVILGFWWLSAMAIGREGPALVTRPMLSPIAPATAPAAPAPTARALPPPPSAATPAPSSGAAAVTAA